MRSIDNGGPAFPTQLQSITADREVTNHEVIAGMSLRDYFAAKAMPSLLQICQNDAREEGLGYPEHIAACAYGIADAMLKVRQS